MHIHTLNINSHICSVIWVAIIKCRKPQKIEDDNIEMNNNNVYGTMQKNASAKGTKEIIRSVYYMSL